MPPPPKLSIFRRPCWLQTADGWKPLWSTLSDVSITCSVLIRCRCNTVCRGNCSCCKAALQCTALCACQGHRRTGQGGGQLPPSLVRNINYSGNLYLRVGQSSCSCFVSLIFSIFSFHLSLARCIKTHTKTQEMA